MACLTPCHLNLVTCMCVYTLWKGKSALRCVLSAACSEKRHILSPRLHVLFQSALFLNHYYRKSTWLCLPLCNAQIPPLAALVTLENVTAETKCTILVCLPLCNEQILGSLLQCNLSIGSNEAIVIYLHLIDMRWVSRIAMRGGNSDAYHHLWWGKKYGLVFLTNQHQAARSQGPLAR